MTIAVVGRQLKHARWEVIFDILESAKEAGIDYETFAFDNCPDVNMFSAGIFLATPNAWKDQPIPTVHFTITNTEDELIRGMQELASKLIGEEDDTIPEVDAGSIPDEPVDAMVDVQDNNDHNTPSALAGLVVEIAGKEVVLNKEDAIQLKEMLVVMKEYGYKVKDVIITG